MYIYGTILWFNLVWQLLLPPPYPLSKNHILETCCESAYTAAYSQTARMQLAVDSPWSGHPSLRQAAGLRQIYSILILTCRDPT